MKELQLRVSVDGEEVLDESAVYTATLPRVDDAVEDVVAQTLHDMGRVGEHPNPSEGKGLDMVVRNRRIGSNDGKDMMVLMTMDKHPETYTQQNNVSIIGSWHTCTHSIFLIQYFPIF